MSEPTTKEAASNEQEHDNHAVTESPPSVTPLTNCKNSAMTKTSTILETLNVLCPSSESETFAFDLERQLVAWVLLSRLNSEEEDLSTTWQAHGERLGKFASQVLLRSLPDNDSTKERELMKASLRLISQVTARLYSDDYPTHLAPTIWESWRQLFVSTANAADKNSNLTDERPMVAVFQDVLSSLEVSLLADPSQAAIFLPQIWKDYQSILGSSSTDPKTPKGAPSTGNGDQDMAQGNVEKADYRVKQDEEEQDWDRMMGTLNRIVDGNTTQNHRAPAGEDPTMALHDLMLGIITQEGMEEVIPDEMIPDLLQWITDHPQLNNTTNSQSKTLPISLRSAWNEWGLTWISTRSTRSVFRATVLKNPNDVDRLQRLLLSNVISPQSDSALRALAWQALVALVEVHGWDWMLSSSNVETDQALSSANQTGNKIGLGKLICTWIRLASGELRIQLQSLVHESMPLSPKSAPEKTVHNPTGASNHSSGWQATGIPIGHGCARLLQNIVGYLIRLSEQPHLTSPMLDPDALLHLRQSLEQTLWTVVEYLSLASSANDISDFTVVDNGLEDPSTLWHPILRLLGTLLMEVSIFDLMEMTHRNFGGLDDDNDDGQNGVSFCHSQPDQVSSPVVILTCLKQVLPMAENTALLPGLVHIMGDADDDPEKKALLSQHIQVPMIEYLEWYWQRGSMLSSMVNGRAGGGATAAAVTAGGNHMLLDDSVAWACSATELWNSLPGVEQTDRRQLALALVQWIQHILQTSNPSCRNYLSLVLGSYMVLLSSSGAQVKQPPTEHEQRVIHRALEWCEHG